MIKQPLRFALLFVGLSCMLLACSGKTKETSPTLAQTETQTMAATLPAETTSRAETSAAAETTASGKPTHTAASETKEKAVISYPLFEGVGKQSDKVNALIKKNASSILEGNLLLDPQKDELAVSYEVIRADSKRITIAYKGELKKDGKTVPLFFTNTIDLVSAKDLGLKDFADPETLAGYLLSEDVQFVDASSEDMGAFLKMREEIGYEGLLEILSGADFPLPTGTDGKATSFPKSFSYENGSDIYFSLPIAANGSRYILIKYSPDSK